MIIEEIETRDVGYGGLECITTLEWDPQFPHVVELVDTRSDGWQCVHGIPRPVLLDATNLDPSADHGVPGPGDVELHVYPTGWDAFTFTRRPHSIESSEIRIPRETVVRLVTESMRIVPLDREDEMTIWKADLVDAPERNPWLAAVLAIGCPPECPCGGRNTPRF